MDGKSKHPLGLNQKIAIIGAGASGLTAAEALKQKGYQHVTIFEKNEYAGGKCLSVDIGSEVYELGAGVLTSNNKISLRLADEYNISIEPIVFGKNIYVDQNGQPKSIWSNTRWLKILWQLFFRYKPLLMKYKTLEKPGFFDIDEAVTVPFKEFAQENNIEDLASLFNLYLTGFGYCYSNHVPTAYILKYASWKTIKAYLKKEAYIFPDGIQKLWSRIAEEHDVRYNSTISQITRGKNSLSVQTQNESAQFDSLILTTPLDELEFFMDVTDQEKSLFRRIETLDYQTIICSVNGLPAQGGFVPDNFTPDRTGHPVFWYYRNTNQNVYSFYVLAGKDMSRETVMENLHTFVGKMGGSIEVVHEFVDWKYFPHINTKALSSGFYETLEKMQGERHTYYLGELLNFSCIGPTCSYAEDHITKYF